MTIARVPSTYTSALPLTPLLKSVRYEENVYTLSDDWFIREDVVVGRTSIDYVLVSEQGIFALVPHKRSGVVHQQADQIFINNERQSHPIQQAWQTVQALEHVLGTKVYPVLVYRELSARARENHAVVGRRGYTAEATESPEVTHWKVQGTLVTSWEHLPAALASHPHRVLSSLNVSHFARQIRLLTR